MNTNRISRRELLKAAGVAALGLPTIVPAAVLGKNGAVAPSNRITLGHIGVGGEGTKNLRIMLTQPDARVLAIGEIDPRRNRASRRWSGRCDVRARPSASAPTPVAAPRRKRGASR